MNATINGKVSQSDIELAKNADIHDLAGELTQLRRISATKYSGPCPICGGYDRFTINVHMGLWNCRHCHEGSSKWDDTISLVRKARKIGFAEAVEYINGGISTGTVRRVEVAVSHDETPDEKAKVASWLSSAGREAEAAHERLMSPAGAAGAAYLESRGLEPETWRRFKLGYRQDVPLPGTLGKKKAEAIVMPWTGKGKVVAMRYRFLIKHTYEDQDGRLITSKLTAKSAAHEFHAPFAGRLFGGLGMGAENQRWLLIVEGELNCMSCWQAAHSTGLDVLSYGSESARLSPELIQYAGRYGTVLVWADRQGNAEHLVESIPGSFGIKSPEKDGGKIDANDMLVAGTLGGFLAIARERVARNDDELRWLLWSILDAAGRPGGIDSMTAAFCKKLGRKLGEEVWLVESDNGRWVTAEE